MRFMIIRKADQDAGAGVMPSERLRRDRPARERRAEAVTCDRTSEDRA
ncbi:MAG: hypothetical protein M3Z15_11795 [Pseudomonadota bacterium]|nr:hypothetical protein [Pseudomonadota bacterium]